MCREQKDVASPSKNNQQVEEPQVLNQKEKPNTAIRVYRKSLEKQGFSPT